MDHDTSGKITLQQVQIDYESYYRISNADQMRTFFMSIVSDSNHWMFIGSNGGLSAGRKDAENTLFPYSTDDKIIESVETTGSKSIFQVSVGDETKIWEPFSIRGANQYNTTVNLYKNVYGNKIIFEEVNHDLDLTFQYQWASSNVYGFVKKSKLTNTGTGEVRLRLLDGLQNIMPYGVGNDLQSQRSNLVNAYKRNEIIEESGLGIFALSAIITDRAEPSEALKANIAWSTGLDNPTHLLSDLQLDTFRKGDPVTKETDVKAEKGAYFVSQEMSIPSEESREWMIVANVNQNVSSIIDLSNQVAADTEIGLKVKEDVENGTQNLIRLNAAADSIQLTRDGLKDSRHFSNTLFNISRGGVFDNNYQIEKEHLVGYLRNANKQVVEACEETINKLPEKLALSDLRNICSKNDNVDFRRLCLEYLPLKYSRRHGDPTRPWNQFTINTYDENDGSKVLYFEGNWRDIFQNWEALVHSYPEFIEGIISKFLNASTFDGYNPYRITAKGLDWERIEPDDPWSYIGYWGDHQLIYLLKFLEFAENYNPGLLSSYFHQAHFVYTNVPYKIKSHQQILEDPKDTIEFDQDLDFAITRASEELGADGAVLRDQSGQIVRANFVEKILATVLAKVGNLIPEAGIWMNTQRPEWNDANNALVGNGVSVVTLCQLLRFVKFLNGLFKDTDNKSISISKEVKTLFDGILGVLEEHKEKVNEKIGDESRRTIVDQLGQATSDFRLNVYDNAFSGDKEELTVKDLLQFSELCQMYLEGTLKSNKRSDNLFYSYNLASFVGDDKITITHLNEMLEGQVAVLGTGFLTSQEALDLLNGLRESALFRSDQHSYMLYPNEAPDGFLSKNNVPASLIEQSTLLQEMVRNNDTRIIQKDRHGDYHFNGDFKNARDLSDRMTKLEDGEYAQLVSSDKAIVLQIYEEVFNHLAFTGRSGTFFGYEGLGSIYWHMVSKLLLAVQASCQKAIRDKEDPELIEGLLSHYDEIYEGIGVHKHPALYGAFPTDPYSHTPAGKGAQQPGMTGQVKEDIINRFGELGITVQGGKLGFYPQLLKKDEFLAEAGVFNYIDIDSDWKQIEVEEGSLCFTYCQTPIIYQLAEEEKICVVFKDGTKLDSNSLTLDTVHSKQVFTRAGEIEKIVVNVKDTVLW